MSQMLININREILKLETMLQSDFCVGKPKVCLGTTISGNATGTVVDLRSSHALNRFVANKIQLIMFIPGVEQDEGVIIEKINQSMSEIIQLLETSNTGFTGGYVEDHNQTPDKFYKTFVVKHDLTLSGTFTVLGLEKDIDSMLVFPISCHSVDEG